MFSVFKGNFVILLLLLKLLPLIKKSKDRTPGDITCVLGKEQQFEFHSNTFVFCQVLSSPELHNLPYKWNRYFSSAHLSLSCGLHYWQSNHRRCTKLSWCTYFLMIFDTNSSSLQMASFFSLCHNIFAVFQTLRKVPVIDFFSQQRCRPPWKTNISIWGKIKNASGRQNQYCLQVVLLLLLRMCVCVCMYNMWRYLWKQ